MIPSCCQIAEIYRTSSEIRKRRLLHKTLYQSRYNPLVCERFEIYINGIEVANCFNELCDLNIQKQRAEEGLLLKNQLYNYSLPTPNLLYRSLEKGLPPSSGIALGVERWLMALTNIESPFMDTDNATAP